MHHFGQAMLPHEVQSIPTQTVQACLEIAADNIDNRLAGDLWTGAGPVLLRPFDGQSS